MSDRSGPCARSAFAARSRSRRATASPSKHMIPAMALIPPARASCGLLAKLGDLGESARLRAAYDHVLAYLDPCMGNESVVVADNAEAKTARDPSVPQHTLRRKCARQTVRLHPRIMSCRLDRPGDPFDFIAAKA